eukprot:10851609-Karenia_brevis.AAC.1
MATDDHHGQGRLGPIPPCWLNVPKPIRYLLIGRTNVGMVLDQVSLAHTKKELASLPGGKHSLLAPLNATHADVIRGYMERNGGAPE